MLQSCHYVYQRLLKVMLLGITRGLVNAVMIIFLTEAHFQET